MKNALILILATGSILASCSKTYTCDCTESYDGASESFTHVMSEEIEGLKKSEAEQKCAQGNVGPQTLIGETWGISCELK
ncbi:MAG: hypothetical protein GQ574_10720 [Crocinitomix sp.]|nr:hypothetical protein [Crocinitomix sp.]